MSLDVVLHLRDRSALFNKVARLLVPAGKFLFTDAGVVSGPISNEEIGHRSVNGHTQFVAPGVNEALLEAAGLRLIGREDRTSSAILNANGRLRARREHRQAIEEVEGADTFRRQQRYLETVVELYERNALSRVMYLAQPASANSYAIA